MASRLRSLTGSRRPARSKVAVVTFVRVSASSTRLAFGASSGAARRTVRISSVRTRSQDTGSRGSASSHPVSAAVSGSRTISLTSADVSM